MGSTQAAALKHVADRFASMKKASVFWPTVPFKNLEWEINNRIQGPSRIYQAKSNLCGMGSFFNTLATDDPYLYAYFLCSVYKCGSAYLGHGKDAPIVKVSKQTRSDWRRPAPTPRPATVSSC